MPNCYNVEVNVLLECRSNLVVICWSKRNNYNIKHCFLGAIYCVFNVTIGWLNILYIAVKFSILIHHCWCNSTDKHGPYTTTALGWYFKSISFVLLTIYDKSVKSVPWKRGTSFYMTSRKVIYELTSTILKQWDYWRWTSINALLRTADATSWALYNSGLHSIVYPIVACERYRQE